MRRRRRGAAALARRSRQMADAFARTHLLDADYEVAALYLECVLALLRGVQPTRAEALFTSAPEVRAGTRASRASQ